MMESLILLTLSFALFTQNLVKNLILLIILMILFFSFIFFKGMATFMALLMLIVFLTGLFVVFSYITSTSPFEKKGVYFFPSFILFMFFQIFFKKKKIFFLKFFPLYHDWSLSGLVLMILLIFFIIFFIRITYSKGGALRRKF